MISNRLKKLASYVESTDLLADIGTDHGYVPIELLEKGVIEKVYASDLNKGPLENAREELSKKGLLNKAELRLGGGLEPYAPGEINTALIAGMGGKLIREILEAGKVHLPYLNKLILQPMHGQMRLRKWLLNHGFEIVDEDLILEKDIFYEVIVAKKGEAQRYNDEHLEFGYHMLKKNKAISKAYIEMKMEKKQGIIKEIEKYANDGAEEKLNQLKKEISRYQELIECL